MLTAKQSEKQFELVPAGSHVARCIGLIDLGTQIMEWQGSKKELHKIRISWEIPDEKRVFAEGKGEQPFVISKEYTLSLSEKSNLRKDLESWRGKQFMPEELKGFDIEKLLDKPCVIQVIHKTAQTSGNDYATITAITSLPKGTVCSMRINPLSCLSFESWKPEIFESLPDYFKDKIRQSKEYQHMTNPHDHEISDYSNYEKDNSNLPF